MKKPPKKYQTITSPKRQLFFIAILWYFFQKKIFLQKKLDGNRLSLRVFCKNFWSNQRLRLL
jgi:hypothetical protein